MGGLARGGGVRLGGFGEGGWEERTWAVVGGDWAVRATTAMSYVSAWDVRAEFVDITSAIVAEETVVVRRRRSAAGRVMVGCIMMDEGASDA